MSLAKLHLFTKDTDATATEQGFYFQKLITLRSWLQNRLNRDDTDIYCDYEEDIFERSLDNKSSTFRQVKLYSDNFSFSKDEIQKSIAHFFMLYCKGDYALDDVTFIFETNSKPSRQYKAADPKLLKEWYENQDQLSPQLLERCRIKVKSIVDQYIKDAMGGKLSPEIDKAMKEAKEVYDRLPDEVWNGFVKSIRWKFDAVPQENAIPQLVKELEELVIQLPFSLNPDQASTYVSVLLSEIAARTAEKDIEKKILTNQKLDILLLNMGSEKDRWYASMYEKWKKAGEIDGFRVGEFYEIIAATRQCRWERIDSDHDELWFSLLKQYIEMEEALVSCRRKAIYEFIFLLLSPDSNTFTIKNTIEGTEHLIRYYFENLESRNSFSDLEEDIILLEIAAKQSLHKPELLSPEDIDRWRISIHKIIDDKILVHRDADELCLALQLMGNFHFHNAPSASLLEKTTQSVKFYSKIPELLSQTKTYSIAALNNQTQSILNILIRLDAESSAISTFEDFLDSIEEFAVKTGQNLETAKTLVQRTFSYLSRPSASNYLAALGCLHKAKDLCNNDLGRPYLIIVLNNISKVYLALGMNLAAKYYGISAVWGSLHFGDHSILKLISDSYASVFHADYQQGSWVSALDDFQNYIYARIEFNADNLDLESDQVLAEVLLELAFILSTAPVIHPELRAFISYQKQKLGWIYTEFLEELGKHLETEFRDEKKLKGLLERKVTMPPFSDIGPSRKIEFDTHGVKWTIAFSNNVKMNAIAEEFTALFQIILCEIRLMGVDLHLIEMPVTIHLRQADGYTQNLKQHMSHDEAVWDLALPVLEQTDQPKIQYHYAFLTTCLRSLLSNISVLPSKEFYDAFDALYTKQNLGHKGLVINTYQKVYFGLLTEEQFNESHRSAFNPVSLNDFNPQKFPLSSAFEGTSSKYDQAASLAKITGRYQTSYKSLSVSLAIWKQDPDFKELVDSYRSEGYLDWQILSALRNFVIAKKVNALLQSNPPATQEEAAALASKLSTEMRTQPEDENYIPIPMESLKSPHFSFYMSKTAVDVLGSFGLENGMKHPNFTAVRNYLSKRFGFASDDYPDENPLIDL